MKHLGTRTLESERLILRKFTLDDAHAMYENWANDSDVTKYLMWKTHENVDASKDIISEWISKYCNDDFYLWAIVLKDGNVPVGSIGVVDKNDAVEMVHIGYCIGKRWWNKGIVSEAFSAVIAYLFDDVGVNRIESRHDPNNPASGKVMLKCGLKYEGTQCEADYNNQGICDAAMYAVLAKEWRA